VELLLVDAFALQAYGYRDRVTRDVDGELSGPIEPLKKLIQPSLTEVEADSAEILQYSCRTITKVAKSRLLTSAPRYRRPGLALHASEECIESPSG
jgi:hypothetical protein